MPRKILIVDDNDINRMMLRSMLSEDYDICEAENGEEALAILRNAHHELSAVILDILMPVMDGYEVLEHMHADAELSQIPVIVATGTTDGDAEIKALQRGANDFITKPYVRDVIEHRLRNTIKLRETAATVNALQRDRLTGLLTREAFFQRAQTMIHEHTAGHYVMACFDIDSFKVINDQYGSEKGDAVLKQVADIFRIGFDAAGGLTGRITADTYAVLYPASFLDSEQLTKIREDAAVLDGQMPPISFSIGRYLVDDLTLPISAMYDRASLARASVKGRFDKKIALYDESMREQLLHEQAVANEMKQALAERQFELWLQPQYNHSSGALIGAEALVRWRHPEKGLILPGSFIPIFERNGFVYELDKYVWERACALLREWIDAGISPLPVSVNVSRYDILRDDLTDCITGLVEKYGIPADLLRLEITETAFSQSADRIIDVVRDLTEKGFTVEIDDFGSGYSSLNTLKDVPAQIVKLDMRFLESNDRSGRGGNILESVVRMTKWLGMAVIAEGVESVEQADYLKSIGCNYVQGYLYARPMPQSEYEALIKRSGKEEKLLLLETVENLDNSAFWDPKSMDTLIFNTYVGGACIFEWHNDRIEILRANEKYAKTIGGDACTVEDALNLRWEEHMGAEAAKATRDAIEQTIATGDDATYEAVYTNLFGSGEETYLRTTFRVIARTTSRYLIYATNENLTAQRRAEREKNKTAEQLEVIMDNISGGVTAVAVEDGVPRILFANEQFYTMLGYAKSQFDKEITDLNSLTHPDDLSRVARETGEALHSGLSTSLIFRVLRRDGVVRWWRSNISIIDMPGIDAPVQLAVANDVTALRETEQRERETAERMQMIMDNTGSGITAFALRDGELHYLFANDRFYELNGYTRVQYETEVESVFDLIHPDDRQRVYDAAQAASEPDATTTLEYRVIRRDGTEAWQRAVVSTRMLEGTDAPVQFSIITDISAEKAAELRIRALGENLQNMMNDTPGGFVRLMAMPDGALITQYANENFCRLIGRSFDELMSAGQSDAMHTVHPDDQETVRGMVAEMIASGETRNIPYRLKRSDGSFIPVNAFGRVSKNEAGESFINVFYTDLSEQEKRDFGLREMMPHLLSASMKYSNDLVFAKDREFRYICCSPAFVKFTRQKSESDVIGRNDYDFWTQEEADHFRGDDVRLLTEGEPLIDYIEPIPSDDGIQHYCRTSKYILRDGAGEIIGMYGIGRDVTEERTAYERLKLLTNSIPGGIAAYEISPEGSRITYFNDGYCNIMGYTREEYADISATGITNITFKEDVPALSAQIEAMRLSGTPIDCTCRVHTGDGGFKWVNIRGNKAEQRGDVCQVNVALFDVTQAKLAEAAALVHEQEMRLAISQMGRMLCEYEPRTGTLTVPEDYAALYDLPSAVIPGVPESILASDIIDEDSAAAYREFFDAIRRGEKTGSMEYREWRADGTAHWERAEFSTIFDAEGHPIKALIAVEDTTEQHQRFELEQSRPSMGEENLLVHALFNLTTGETLEYAYRDGSAVPVEDRTALGYGEELVNALFIDEGERERYRAYNDAAALLRRFERGETELSVDYRRRLPDGDIVWVRNIMRMVLAPGGSDVLLFDYFYNVEEEKTREQMNATLLNNNYEYVARINGRNRHFVVMVSEAARDGRLPEKGDDLDDVVRAIVNDRVHPDDRETVLHNMLVENIKRNLAASGRFQFTFRIKQSDTDVQYKRITQYYLDRQRDIIILTREDVTELMREEARKAELLEAALEAANEESRVKERKAAAQLKAIMNNVDGGMSAATLIDGEIGYLYVNDTYYAMFGYTREQFERELPRGLVDIIHPDDLKSVYDMAERSVASGTERLEFRVYKRDGSLLWVRSISSTCEIEGIDAPVHIAVLIDMTKEREMADALRISEEQYRIAATIGSRAIASYDIKTGVYHHHDDVLLAMGFDEDIENVPQAFLDRNCIAPESVAEFLEYYEKLRRGEPSCSIEMKNLMDDGAYHWQRQDATVIFDADGKPSQAILVMSDITETREKEAAYKEHAETDPLTGILNRVAFVQTVEGFIEGPDAADSLALMLLDLDGFKLINDTFGHAAGDQVLLEIADSLRSVLRKGDALGRLGGDEFLICMKNMPNDRAIQRKAGQICAMIRKALNLEVFISASIGIAVYPRDGSDFETLYRKMDTALYTVKDRGKNHYAFYSEDMGGGTIEHADMEKRVDLAALIERQRKPRLLLVDGDRAALDMLAGMLADEYSIDTARDRAEALALMRRYGTDVACVLLDLDAPGVDGLAVLDQLRDGAELPLPVIVISDMDGQESALRAIACGAADYVPKPVNADLLLLRVRSAISRAESERLRAQNSLLLMHTTEAEKYRAALESALAAVIEYEPASGLFLYDSAIGQYVDGDFDDRALWEVLLSSGAATVEEAAKVMRLIEELRDGDGHATGRVKLRLRTPAGDLHDFLLSAKMWPGSDVFPDRIILTLLDAGQSEA